MSLEGIRIYSDPDGESHFGTINVGLSSTDFAPPAPPLEVSKVEDGRFGFLRAGSDWFGDWHPTPARQFMCLLSGSLEVRVSDGETRLFEPGTVVLLEDTYGQGHSTRVASNEAAVLVFVQLP